MSLLSTRVSFLLLLSAFELCFGFSRGQSLDATPGTREKLALLPMELTDVSTQEGSQLLVAFAAALGESKRFDVLVNSTSAANTVRALAEAGKALGANKVVHVRVVRRKGLYVLSIRLVSVDGASLLYSERVDYSGEFNSFLSEVIPEQARKLSKAHLDAKTPWAKAAFLFGGCLGAILWILWHFRRKNVRGKNMITVSEE